MQADSNAKPSHETSRGRATICPVILRLILLVEEAQINTFTVKYISKELFLVLRTRIV